MAPAPWVKQQQPAAAPAPWKKAKEPGALGTAMDVARSIPSGVRLGMEGLSGMGGDLYNLQVTAAEKIAQWLGADPETLASIREARGQNWLPTSSDVEERVTNPLMGEKYQPTTRLGQGAQTVSSFLPGAGRSLLRTVVGPGLGVEAGGEIGERLGSETAGKLIGGLVGGSIPGATARTVAGPRVSPERARHIQTMEREGIPLTGGQSTGKQWIKAVESGPFGGNAANVNERQSSAFNRAALRRAGVDSDIASPEVMTDAREALGAQFDDVIARNNGAPMDAALQNELLDTAIEYQRLKGNNAAPIVEDYLNRIVEGAQANGGILPGDVFKTIRSDMSRTLRTSKDPEVIQALRSMQDSLFESIGRNGQPDIVAEARDLNRRYRNFKITEKSMTGAGEATAEGNITPRKLRAAAEQNDRGSMVYGRGDFGDLARAGEATMTPLPNSGTGARLTPFALLTAASAPLLQGDLKTAGTLALSSLAPWAASKLATSGPVSRSITNQAMGRSGPIMDPVTAALIARQAELEGRQ